MTTPTPATETRTTRRGFLRAAGRTCAALWATLWAALSGFDPQRLGAASRSAEARALEYRVKAAFLFNFVRFVEWPERRSSARTPFVIGVYGDDPFGSILRQTTRGKAVADRAIEVRRAADLGEAGDCDVLFVSDSERDTLAQILESLRGAGVLSVGESDSFLDDGGMINFVIDSERVRFEVDLDSVRAEGLDLSSQLLKVAHNVRYDARDGGKRR